MISVIPMNKNNSRFDNKLKDCSPLQFSCTLTGMKLAIGATPELAKGGNELIPGDSRGISWVLTSLTAVRFPAS